MFSPTEAGKLQIVDGKYDLTEILEIKTPFGELAEKVAYQWMPSACLETFRYDWSYQTSRVDPSTGQAVAPYDDQISLILEMTLTKCKQLAEAEADEATLDQYRSVDVGPYEVAHVQTGSVVFVAQSAASETQTRRLLRSKTTKKSRGIYSMRYQSSEEFSLKSDHTKVAWLAKQFQKKTRCVENDYGLPSWK